MFELFNFLKKKKKTILVSKQFPRPIGHRRRSGIGPGGSVQAPRPSLRPAQGWSCQVRRLGLIFVIRNKIAFYINSVSIKKIKKQKRLFGEI